MMFNSINIQLIIQDASKINLSSHIAGVIVTYELPPELAELVKSEFCTVPFNMLLIGIVLDPDTIAYYSNTCDHLPLV